MVKVIHKLRGRARFKVAHMRGSTTMVEYLEYEIRLDTGVKQVSANATTGNILIVFTEVRTVSALTCRIEKLVRQHLAGAVDAGDDTSRLRKSSREETSAQSWHLMAPEEVLQHLNTISKTGLSAAQAEKRLDEYGLNTLPVSTARSLSAIFKDQLNALPMILIFAAAGIAIFTGGAAEGFIALMIAGINAAIGAVTEHRAERTIKIVRESVDLRARIMRGGCIEEISFERIVRGDVVDLQAGSRVPADLRLIEAEYLCVDEAALTGESIPVIKTPVALTRETGMISRRSNMLYRGTLVVEGSGRAVVVATGNDTVIGRLQHYLGAVLPPEALVADEIHALSKHLVWVGGIAFGLYAIISLLRGYSLLQVFRSGLLLFAGAIPAGLSTLFVSAFAFGHRDLQANHILVRRMRALGSLASVQVVCFDKTGTLTQNRMTVAEIGTANYQVKIGLNDSENMAEFRRLKDDPDFSWLIKLTTLCNESYMLHEGAQSLEGSSTEKAFIHLAEQLGINTTAFRGEHPIEEIFHRTEQRHFMVTLHHWDGSRQLTAVKGSPLEVLERCTFFQQEGQILILTDEELSRIEEKNFKMASRGLRVLGVAYCWGQDHLRTVSEPAGRRLVWCGLVGLADPIRKGAPILIEKLHRAGIKTVVITGDQSLTAQHIGKELGLSGQDPLRILDSRDMISAKIAGIDSVVTRTHVFAQLNPTQKLQVIQAYQKAGLTVVMVGDGFNDVLALKVADVGFAMGREGADLARRTADLVLEDDNLESVMAAIVNGRTFYGNMQRSLKYILTTSHMDVLADVFTKSGIGGAGPSPLQNVWTNLACLSLAVDVSESDLLNRPLIGVDQSLLSDYDRKQAAADAATVLTASLMTAGYGLMRYGVAPEASILFWRSLSINQLLYAQTCRKRNAKPAAQSPANTLLRATLWGVTGSHLLAIFLSGTGWGWMVTDAMALGVSAWLSKTLFQKTKPLKNPQNVKIKLQS